MGQTFPPQEVIVVNDGSTDNTEDLLEPFRGRIHYIRQENQGPAAARNRGIAESRGDLIAFLDADDLWAPDKLEVQLKHLEEHPEVKLVHRAFWNLDMSTGQITTPRNLRDYFTGNCYRDFFWRNGVQISSRSRAEGVLAQSWWIRSEHPPRSTEDYDLWFRIARDYQFGYVRRPLVYYRHHGANATRGTIAILEGELYVLNKAMRADPQLVDVIGMSEVRNRLHGLFFDIGYKNHDAHNPAQARSSFIEALRLHPRDFYTWVLLLTNCLPSVFVQQLRMLKASLTHNLRRKASRA